MSVAMISCSMLVEFSWFFFFRDLHRRTWLPAAGCSSSENEIIWQVQLISLFAQKSLPGSGKNSNLCQPDWLHLHSGFNIYIQRDFFLLFSKTLQDFSSCPSFLHKLWQGIQIPQVGDQGITGQGRFLLSVVFWSCARVLERAQHSCVIRRYLHEYKTVLYMEILRSCIVSEVIYLLVSLLSC